MTFLSPQPKISNNSTNSTPYMHFATLLLENLPLTPHFEPSLWAIYQCTLINMYKYLPATSFCAPFLTCARGRPPSSSPSLRHCSFTYVFLQLHAYFSITHVHVFLDCIRIFALHMYFSFTYACLLKYIFRNCIRISPLHTYFSAAYLFLPCIRISTVIDLKY